MPNFANEQQLKEFVAMLNRLDGRVEKLELAHQPIQGNTIKASQDRIYFNLFAESPSVLTTDAFTGSLGAIIYDTGSNKNAAPAVQFYKKSNMTFIDGLLLVQFFEGQGDTGSAYVPAFCTNIRVRLNGIRTRTQIGVYPYNSFFYRINGGTILTMDGESNNFVNPSSDGQVYIKTLNASDISNMVNGVNSITVQTDSDSATNYCYAKAYLILSGYETRS